MVIFDNELLSDLNTDHSILIIEIHLLLNESDMVFPLIGIVLSIPVFLHGLTQLMTLVTSFVTDVFAGEERLYNILQTFFTHMNLMLI